MTDKQPKYQQVIDWVRENIADGTLRPGEKLMSEAELGAKFGLSRQTIRHATGELEKEKLVTRVRGSGTYVGGKQVRAREARFMNIAVVSTFYESYIFPPTLKGIEGVLSKHGYSMQVAFTDNRISREKAILEALLEKDNIDGLIVEPAKSALPNPNLDYYRRIQEKHIPILFFNAFYRGIEAPCVRIDDAGIAEKAAGLLIRDGHKRIGGIFKCDDGQGPLRYEGYVRALLEAGLTVDQERVVWMDTPTLLEMSRVEEYLFRRLEDCSAVVCYNDQVAYQLIELALRRGMSVPEDLSVVGIDDSYLTGVSRVPLTSFPHPKEQLGQKAAENLVRMIEEPGFDGNYLYDSEAVERSSTAPPKIS